MVIGGDVSLVNLVPVTRDPDYNIYGNGSADMWRVSFDSSGNGSVYNDLGTYQYTATVNQFAGHISGNTIGLGTSGEYWENISNGNYWLGKYGALYSANIGAQNYGRAINAGNLAVNNSGSIVISGGWIESINGIEIHPGGSIQMNGGEITVHSGGISVGGTLSGTGKINGGVEVSGILSIGGFQIGKSLALLNSSTTIWGVTPDGLGGYTSIPSVIGGTLSIAYGANLELSGAGIDFTSGYWDTDHTFEIFSAETIINGEGIQLVTNDIGSDRGGWALESGSQAVTLRWTAIPEPATLTLLPFALALFIRRGPPPIRVAA